MKLFRALRIPAIILSVLILLFVSLYWILSSTLLNQDFYIKAVNSGEVEDSFKSASIMLHKDGSIILTSQAIQDNVLSLVDGIIRFITRKDMSLSDIPLEEDNINSIRSAILAASPEAGPNVPDISRIHPFVLTYFIPYSHNIYFYLQIIQSGYALYRLFNPILCFLIIFMLLISDKPAENTRTALFTTGLLIAVSGLFILIFRNQLFLSQLAMALPDSVSLFLPLISRIIFHFLIYCIFTGLLFLSAAMILYLRTLQYFINRNSKKIAVLTLVILGLLFVLYRQEFFTDIPRYIKNTTNSQQIYTLNQNEGVIHSLTIKLRENGTNRPVRDVKVMVTGADSIYNPLWLYCYSDVQGNARFILPKGDFYVYADNSTIPSGFVSFQPVTLPLGHPGNSSYTLHLQRKKETRITPAILSSGSFPPSGRPAP